ncbi:signal peptide peptidase-domain-containing protein [Dissophora ornata]|nr:signal peptide peptidase-domain-containing protein [Dissophora ornata]
MAIAPIYFGSFASLKKWKNPTEKKRTIKKQINESDDEEEDGPSESVSLLDAYTFPVLGSMALYGLHLAFTHVDKDYVNYVLTAYFGVMGILATTQVGVNILSTIVGLLGLRIGRYHINLVKSSSGILIVDVIDDLEILWRWTFFTIIHLAMLVISVLLSGYYVVTKNWIVSNIFAFSFALSAIQVISLQSFKTGIILLCGMSLFDVLWEFGRDVMSTIIKNFDEPVKIMFPQHLFGLPAGQAYKLATLGLGDIVIPGVFLALCLRFDQYRAGTKNPELGRSGQFRKPYFTAAVVAYVLGLGAWFFITHVHKNAPPVLVFVSAACIISVLMTASIRGEMKRVFTYVSEEGLEAARIKKEAYEKRRRQQARYAPRASRLPNVIKEESFVSSGSSSPRLNAGENVGQGN